MNRPCIPLLALFTVAGCIESSRRTQTEDTFVDVDTTEDTAQIDTTPDPDTTTDDTFVPDDTDVPLDVPDTSNLPCLPAGCVGPGPACALNTGFCWIDGCVAQAERNPENSCQHCHTATSVGDWTTRADGESCDDGIDCTANDFCRQGSCLGDSLCSSELACVTSQCDPTKNACVDTIHEEMCLFGGECYANGKYTPQNCGRCVPSVSKSTPVPGDPQEPNDDLDQATSLAFDASTVGWNGPWTQSTLSPALDTDAYAWIFNTMAAQERLPVVKISREDALQLEVCVYMQCLPESGQDTRPSTEVRCPDGIGGKTHGNWIGCCQNTEREVFEFSLAQGWCTRSGFRVATQAEAAVTLRRLVPPVDPACYPYALHWGVR